MAWWDAASLVIGIVVGTAIYRVPGDVFRSVATASQGLLLWLLGGVLSLCGALCYAELATTYPRNGGDYEYLSRAFGRPVGVLFGWAQLTVVMSGSIGAMAFAFADYAGSLTPSLAAAGTVPWVAAGAVLSITLLNLMGLVVGKTVQNLLSAAKLAGLVAVIIAALLTPNGAPGSALPQAVTAGPGMSLALVFVLYAFGGWNDAAYVAAEVRDTRRDLPRALLTGVAGITAIYVLANVAYLRVLGLEGVRSSTAPAADVLLRAVGPWGQRAIAALVMISALGAINGMTLAGARIYSELGSDVRRLRWLVRGSRRMGPTGALVAQAAITLFLIAAVGTAGGRRTVDRLLVAVGMPGLPWDDYFGGFETLVAGSAPVFWAFFLLTGISLLVLRVREPQRVRPFRLPLFPLPALVFCASCAYMLYASVRYARWLTLLGILPMLTAIPFYCSSRNRDRSV